MSGRVHRDFRRQAGKVASQTIHALAQPLNAAITNEELTRERVERIEAILGRKILGRLRWLLRGK